MIPEVIVEKGRAIAPSGNSYRFRCIGGCDFQVYAPGSQTVIGYVGKFLGSTPVWMVRPASSSAWLKAPSVHKWQDAIVELIRLLENDWRLNPPRPERAASVNGISIE
jgi:hypothetical protein